MYVLSMFLRFCSISASIQSSYKKGSYKKVVWIDPRSSHFSESDLGTDNVHGKIRAYFRAKWSLLYQFIYIKSLERNDGIF